MKLFLVWGTFLTIISGFLWFVLPKDHNLKTINTWQRMALPGELSKGHAFLAKDCSGCHTPLYGVNSSTCISCHANDESLLQRQPTFFHVSIDNCMSCHMEHQGKTSTTVMDHELFTKISIQQLSNDKSQDIELEKEGRLIAEYIRSIGEGKVYSTGKNEESLSIKESVLNCSACHSNEDPHRSYFGDDCAECHYTRKWTISSFQHPSPSSKECAQCHAAPPSHYMMHFKMISAKVAGKPHAKVNECFECHETTSWNDIRDVGWYKHH